MKTGKGRERHRAAAPAAMETRLVLEGPSSRTLQVEFACDYETHPLDDFQEGGHFVPGMTDVEQRRREWQGDTVHVLVLKHKGGQVLRVLADSLEEAERLMRDNIKSTLFGLWLAQTQTEFSYDQMKRLVDRAGLVQAFLDSHPVLTTRLRFDDVFDAALYYMEKAAQAQP
jgi:hypothetical protein